MTTEVFLYFRSAIQTSILIFFAGMAAVQVLVILRREIWTVIKV